MQGDQLTFDNLTVNFIVDEFLENYLSLHEWLIGIGFPKSRKQFSDFKVNTSNTPATARSVAGTSTDIGDVQKALYLIFYHLNHFLLAIDLKLPYFEYFSPSRKS